MRRLALLPLVLVLLAGGCTARVTSASGGRPFLLDTAPRRTEAPYTASMKPNYDAQGRTWYLSRRIDLADRLLKEQTLANTVAAHELGHVVGAKHNDRAGHIIMASRHGFKEAPINELSAGEIAQARASLGRVVPIRADASVPPMLYEALRWGCALWNRALGEDVLRLEPR